jgi:uncharacterized membrane protein YfcA
MEPAGALLTWGFFAALGCLSGLLAGLLGIGGGLIVVPGLIFGLPLLGVSGPEVPKIAVATSLALVIPTGLASVQTHAAKGAVGFRYAALLAPAVIAGSFLAALLARFLDSRLILFAFAGFAIVFAARLLRQNEAAAPAKPERAGKAAALALKVMGGSALACLLGLGGGFFSVPLLSRFLPMKTAIGTSSLLGLPLAAAGVAGYLLGPKPAGCETACAGAIFVPALAGIGVLSVLTAPLGANLAHLLPVPLLKRVFAGLLLLTAASLTFKAMPPVNGPELNTRAFLVKLIKPACRFEQSRQLSLHKP